ncbi:MAG: hypothetical protein PHD97_02010 [Bacteroidales bacterium]|nr:hypothetical protein [Bacteroidales bacterium]
MDKKTKNIRDKILKGIEIAFKKLLESKIKEDGELIFSIDGKIKKIKAKNFIKS